MTSSGFGGPLGDWETTYRQLPSEKLPWNAGRPDPHLTRLVESGGIPRGKALDLGCGLGYDAVFLARAGFEVLAIDVSLSAVAAARKRAAEAGVSPDLRVGDALELKVPRGSIALVHDRGFFHVLSPADRKRYARRVRAALAKDGRLVLQVFSDKEPPGPGPFRFSRKRLARELKGFSFVELRATVIDGPRRPKAWFCVLKRKEPPYRRLLEKLKKKRKRGPKEWSIYVAECADGSLYTGIAKDPDARIETHNRGRGAAYTRTRRPVRLVYREDGLSFSGALVREAEVKTYPRERKAALIRGAA